MTTILADAKKRVMVCDSKATLDGLWFPITKVYQIEGELIGFAGLATEGTQWLDWYANGQRGRMPSINNVTPMILSENGVSVVESSGRFVRVERGFHAIGSGGNAALGAFMAGVDAKKAVEIACQIDAGSGGQIHVHKLKAQ
jgi:ATP-dependent protease HslVU (ClpYQ) peptidase subunit